MSHILSKAKCVLIAYIFFNVFILHAENLVVPNSNNSNLSEKPPASLLNAKYFIKHNEITWENIKEELEFKKSFFLGRHPEKPFIRCHKYQRRIVRAIDRTAQNNELKINKIDNEFLFGEDSSIEEILSPQVKAPSINCNFHSIGDITKGCVIYCDYHGMDLESDYFKKYQKEFEATRPFITSEDVSEIIIFSPSLLMFVIIGIMLRKKKRKNLSAA